MKGLLLLNLVSFRFDGHRKESLEPEKEGLMAINKGTTGNGHTRYITEAMYKTEER